MSQQFAVEPGLSTEGPVVRFGTSGAAYLHPQAAAALALDLIGAATVARYEGALANVLAERGHDAQDIANLTRDVRDLINPPAPPSADPADAS